MNFRSRLTIGQSQSYLLAGSILVGISGIASANAMQDLGKQEVHASQQSLGQNNNQSSRNASGKKDHANCIFAGGIANHPNCETKIYKSFDGTLSPGSDPSPQTSCYVPPHALAVYFGSNVAWTTSFPSKILRLGRNLLTITKDNEKISITSFSLQDDEGSPVLYLDKNGFNVPESYEFNHTRNSLTIIRNKEIIFKLTYINSNFISIEGVFLTGDGMKIHVSSVFAGIPQNNRLIIDSCWGNTTANIFLKGSLSSGTED